MHVLFVGKDSILNYKTVKNFFTSIGLHPVVESVILLPEYLYFFEYLELYVVYLKTEYEFRCKFHPLCTSICHSFPSFRGENQKKLGGQHWRCKTYNNCTYDLQIISSGQTLKRDPTLPVFTE